MLAIIEDSATQFKVKEGDFLEVDLRDLTEGEPVVFDKVCLLTSEDNTKVGAPYVEGAKVTARVIEEVKGPKTISMHFFRRKGSKVRKGHRQKFIKVQIEKIEG